MYPAAGSSPDTTAPMQVGKANGLSEDCFGDICLGNMPNIYPWIIDNIAEAMLAKRRA